MEEAPMKQPTHVRSWKSSRKVPSFRFRIEHTGQGHVRISLVCLKVTGSQLRKSKTRDPSLITLGSTSTPGCEDVETAREYEVFKHTVRTILKFFTCLNIFSLWSSGERLAIAMNFNNQSLPLASHFTRSLLLLIIIMTIKDEFCFLWFVFTTQCDQHDALFLSPPCLLSSGTPPLQWKQARTFRYKPVISTRGLSKPVAS